MLVVLSRLASAHKKYCLSKISLNKPSVSFFSATLKSMFPRILVQSKSLKYKLPTLFLTASSFFFTGFGHRRSLHER